MKGNCEEKGITLFDESIINMAKREIQFEIKTSQCRCLSFCYAQGRCSGCRVHLFGWIKLCF